MLRSLVGSEMCIRDSSLILEEKVEETDSYIIYNFIPSPNKSSLAQVILCLLYTSDAADDLLCVDLGGRRIIKKKNQQKP